MEKKEVEIVLRTGLQKDNAQYLYFLNKDGDICRVPRNVGGVIGTRRK